MTIEEMTNRCGEWLKGSGPESDIVMSSRIRLARNLADYPFIRRCTDIDRANIEAMVRERLVADPRFSNLVFINVSSLEDVDRQFLVERQLISRELANAEGARSVAIDENEQLSLMVNEEDHFRIQVMKSGLDLHSAYEKINQLDDIIESHVNYAFHPMYGYLTGCPTNVGTGLRASCMLHLPSLVLTKQVHKVLQALAKLNLAARGLYGEGTQATGNFFQFSNQMTLGQPEEEIIENLASVIRQVVEHEKDAREHLKDKRKAKFEDQIWRALGILKSARLISSSEATQLLSMVHLGILMGLVQSGLTKEDLNALFLLIQPAHLQKITAKTLNSSERDVCRADLIRERLSKVTL